MRRLGITLSPLGNEIESATPVRRIMWDTNPGRPAGPSHQE
jgi:hypothetical protein